MKRSEMLELIQDYLNFVDQPRAIAVLTIIEEAGMRTPLRYKEIDDELLGHIRIAVDGWDDESTSNS